MIRQYYGSDRRRCIVRLKDVRMPRYYLNYQYNILEKVQSNYRLATEQ